jgi:cbb3-type cytochrome c oxidase subunit II
MANNKSTCRLVARSDRDQQLPDDRADPDRADLFGGLVEIVPLFFQKSTTQPVEGVKPYTALQLAGRDVYVREGCYNCHSQMIRPFRAETLRYGHYSVAGEFVYDHPFQWGSKRTGPDLHRVGGRTATNGTAFT